MATDLSNRGVVVTAAAQEICHTTTEVFSRADAKVRGTDLNEGKPRGVAARLIPLRCKPGVLDEGAVSALFNEIGPETR